MQLQTEARLIKLLDEGNFSNAISLLLECQQVALSFKHFQCVAALSGKLQDTLVMAEEQLDVSLAKVCETKAWENHSSCANHRSLIADLLRIRQQSLQSTAKCLFAVGEATYCNGPVAYALYVGYSFNRF